MQAAKKAIVIVLLLVSMVLFCGDVVALRIGRSKLKEAAESVDDALVTLRESTDDLEEQMEEVGVSADLHSFQRDLGKICGTALDGKLGYGETFIGLQRLKGVVGSIRSIEQSITTKDIEIDLQEAGADLGKTDLDGLRAAGVEVDHGRVRVDTTDMIDRVMPAAMEPLVKIARAVEDVIGFVSFLFLMVLLIAAGLMIYGGVSVIRGKTGPIGYTIYTSIIFFISLILTGLLSMVVRGLFPAGGISLGIAPTFWLMEICSVAAAILWGKFKSAEKKAAQAQVRPNGVYGQNPGNPGLICRNCGSPLMQDAFFCTVCGCRR